MFQHILLATDGSAASDRAIRLSVELAREQSAVLTVVFVVDPYPYLGIGEANPLGLGAYIADAQRQAAVAHAKVIELAGGPGERVDVRVRLVEDVTAVKGILATAEEVGADLIVVGSHGRTGLERLALGSVSSKLAAMATIPVLIVRGEGASA